MKDFQTWKSSRESTPLKQRTPVKEGNIEELEEMK
jgi:hypothetical protein